MKALILLPISIAMSVVSFTLMKTRVKELIAAEKKDTLVAVKLRVLNDILDEYEKEIQSVEGQMKEEKSAQEELRKAITGLAPDTKKKAALDACEGAKKTKAVQVEALQKKVKTFQDESTKERSAWEKEMATLKETLDLSSPICNYLKSGATLPGVCPVKKEIEPPKPQEENKEPPKAEDKKAEEAKQEAPKQEAPKQEAPKQEAPKQEAPKQEAPKQEAPKQEAPKEEAKPEAPKK